MIREGGNITVEAGEQALTTEIYIGYSPVHGPLKNVWITGQGTSTVLKRGADMPSGKGLLNVYGEDVLLRDFAIDGDVTTSANVAYTELGDPLDDNLSLNSSIWIHEGCKNIRLENLLIRHTGGYAIVIDARAGDIINV